MKRKIFSIIELILQFVAVVLLFVDGAFICGIGDHTFSYVESRKAIWVFIVLMLFNINCILCLISIIRKSNKKDSIWHISFPIINIVVCALSETMTFSCYRNYYSFNGVLLKGAFFYVIMIVLAIIIFLSFIKRSNWVILKEDTNTQPIINGVRVTSSTDELKKFKELLDIGAITQEEFDQKKKELLGL